MAGKARPGASIAQETTSLLIDSRERLTDTHENLYETKDVMNSAKYSIREIENKAFRQKLWLWVVIFVLFCANVSVIIVLIRNGGKFYSRG